MHRLSDGSVAYKSDSHAYAYVDCFAPTPTDYEEYQILPTCSRSWPRAPERVRMLSQHCISSHSKNIAKLTPQCLYAYTFHVFTHRIAFEVKALSRGGPAPCSPIANTVGHLGEKAEASVFPPVINAGPRRASPLQSHCKSCAGNNEAEGSCGNA